MKINDIVYVLINKNNGHILGDGECLCISTDSNYLDDFKTSDYFNLDTLAAWNGCEANDIECRKIQLKDAQ